MMDKDIKRIEDYLTGRLSDKDRDAFLNRLESDQAFKKQFEFEKQLFDAFNEDSWSYADKADPKVKAYKSALETAEFSALKQSIAKASKNYTDNTAKPQPSGNLIYYAAAAVIAILIVFQFMFKQSPNSEELYYSYVAMEDLPSFVTRNDSAETEAVKAQELFDKNQYDACIPLFQDLLMSNPKDSRLYLYLGIAQAEMENYEESLRVFDKLINSDLLDAEKGYWYKALTYLKMEDEEKALATLHKIESESLYHAEKAAELIDAINK